MVYFERWKVKSAFCHIMNAEQSKPVRLGKSVHTDVFIASCRSAGFFFCPHKLYCIKAFILTEKIYTKERGYQMKLVYDINDKPKFSQNIVFAFQQILAIITATILVPLLVNQNGVNGINLHMDIAAALFGAGMGTLVYLLFTKGKSPAFLGSSFAFLQSMYNAVVFGYFGIIVGAVLAGLVYAVIALVIHFAGTKWIDKLMPPVIIGPTVALIGLGLAGGAISNLTSATAAGMGYNLIAILCGISTLVITIIASVKGGKTMRLIPFIIGIAGGYIIASIFTIFGEVFNCDYLKIVDYSAIVNNFKTLSLESFIRVPDFTFVEAFREVTSEGFAFSLADLGSLALLFVPVAFVVFAEHIADHKNLSSIINRDLLGSEPGLKRTLLGDGVGSMVGAFFGGCANTTYGESVGCVAITGNASVSTIILTAIMALLLSFLTPIVAIIETIPSCVIGGICVALYGFIAVSGLRMLKNVNLDENKNLFVVSTILVCGIGGLTLNFGKVSLTNIATALILGIIVNLIVNAKSKKKAETETTEDK